MAIDAIVFALALVAAACGSDDADDAEDTGQVEVTTPTTQAPEPPAEPGEDPEPGETQPPATALRPPPRPKLLKWLPAESAPKTSREAKSLSACSLRRQVLTRPFPPAQA